MDEMKIVTRKTIRKYTREQFAKQIDVPPGASFSVYENNHGSFEVVFEVSKGE
jgi:hypothetical protein